MASCSCRHYLQSSKRLSIIVSDLQIFSNKSSLSFVYVLNVCSKVGNFLKSDDNILRLLQYIHHFLLLAKR
nr:MAG TPA: hypothetical protein [Caudoviricetes sp.]